MFIIVFVNCLTLRNQSKLLAPCLEQTNIMTSDIRLAGRLDEQTHGLSFPVFVEEILQNRPWYFYCY